MSLAPVAFVVISKYPTPGRVKTRLTPALTPQQAADVHRIFLLHLLRRLRSLAPAELIVCHDPPESREPFTDLLADFGPQTLLPQSAGDLGHRLAAIAATVLQRHPRIVLLGVDSPDLPDTHLRGIAESPARADVSLGLATDGGYWAIGLRAGVDPAALLDANIDWSTHRTAAQTLHNAHTLGYRTEADFRWDDVDEPQDLRRLINRLALSQAPDDVTLRTNLLPILSATDPSTPENHKLT
jgi:rSAM/selenodomain-associated transferase 1